MRLVLVTCAALVCAAASANAAGTKTSVADYHSAVTCAAKAAALKDSPLPATAPDAPDPHKVALVADKTRGFAVTSGQSLGIPRSRVDADIVGQLTRFDAAVSSADGTVAKHDIQSEYGRSLMVCAVSEFM